MGFSTEPIEQIDWFERYENPRMFEPSTNQFGCVGRGYPKPHPTGRSRWKGFAVGLFVRYP